MRILHIEYAGGFGGSIVSLSDLLRGIQEKGGHESVVVSLAPPEVTDGYFPGLTVVRMQRVKLFPKWFDFEGMVHAVRTVPLVGFVATRMLALVRLYENRALGRKLTKVAKRYDAELIHLNNGLGMSGIDAARRTGLPCIMHHRGPTPAWSANAFRRAERWLGPIPSRHICVSRFISGTLTAAGVSEEKVETIYDPIVAEAYRRTDEVREEIRAKWGIGEDRLVASVIGRVVPWKGQLEFLEGMEPLLERCPNLTVMIVGDASAEGEAYMQKVRDLAASDRWSGRIVLTGFQNDVAAYYAAADIIVHCSREPEPFGRSSVEAWAASRPLIAIDEGGPAEVVTNGVDGLLAAPRDADSMNAALERLYHDDALRAELVRRGWETVEADYGPVENADRVLRCFERVL